jgi:hypothetical protein
MWCTRVMLIVSLLRNPWGAAIRSDGTIVGFDLTTGKQIDYLRDPQGHVIAINGLWTIFFGNGASLGRADFCVGRPALTMRLTVASAA